MTAAHKLTNEIKYRLAAGRAERIYVNHPDKGLSFGPRQVHFSLDNVHITDNHYRGEDTAWLFSFGAYSGTHVVAFGSLEDALEDAAATLLEVAPGMFTDPEYPERTAEQSDDEFADALLDAEADLTYTESGWLPSWEWTCREVTPEEILAFVRNEG